MPHYAGQKLRVAMAHLLLEERKPVELRGIERSWWQFDTRGRIRAGHVAATRAAMSAAPGYAE
jgi:hypothetical protein